MVDLRDEVRRLREENMDLRIRLAKKDEEVLRLHRRIMKMSSSSEQK